MRQFADEKIRGFAQDAAQIPCSSKIARIDESLAGCENLEEEGFDGGIASLFTGLVEVRRVMRQDGHGIEDDRSSRLPGEDPDGKTKNFGRQ